MLKRAMFAVLFAGLVLLYVAPVLAQEFCLGTSATNRFHLEITAQTTTSQGTVMSLVGVRHVTGEADVRSPVTGTLFVEPGSLAQFRVSLLEMNSIGAGANLIWNARLRGLEGIGNVSLVYTGTVTIDRLPEGTALFSRSSGTMTVVDCLTGTTIVFPVP